jgi:2'-5' RNA ligase
MPRLFTGLEIPPDIALMLSTLRGGLPGARWIEPSDYHITLRFIGDIDERTACEIDDMLADVSRRPFTITLSELGSFGGDRPRSVHMGVEPCRELMELQSDIERILRRLGLPPETRKFVPHVTLARLRNSTPIDVADYLASRGHVPSQRIGITEFAMFSSRASVGGGPYVVEAVYAFAAFANAWR